SDDIEDADGTAGANFAYQWISGGTDIVGEKDATYTVDAADLGAKITVRVTFDDDLGNPESVTSDATRPVVPAANENCDAPGTVWCTTLTAGVVLEELDPGLISTDQAGYSAEEGYGGLADDTFTLDGVEYTVTLFVSSGNNDLYLATTPNLPAHGAGLTAHVQRVVGEVDIPLGDGVFDAADEEWYFFGVLAALVADGATFEDSPLLHAPYNRSIVVREPTDEDTEIAVRFSVVSEEEAGAVLVSNAGRSVGGTTGLGAFDHAQGFETGSNAWGYTLKSIGVVFRPAGPVPSATLHKDSPSNAAVATLEQRSRASGTFDAPPDTVLDPDSTYYLLLDGGSADLELTDDDTEDGLAGWAVLDVGHYRDKDSSGPFTEIAEAKMIVVRGHVNSNPDAAAVRFAQHTYSVVEGGAVDVAVELNVPLTAPVTVPVTWTERGGAAAGDYALTGATSLEFPATVVTKTFRFAATDDSADDDGENVLFEFGDLPQELLAGEIPATVVEIEDDDGAAPVADQLRLAGGESASEGRLEIPHDGEWGTVCDDRMDREGNFAPTFACRLLGYDTGTIVDGRPGTPQRPIWLDDVYCPTEASDDGDIAGPAWTGDYPETLSQCYHAGWGLNNCVQEEDVSLRCANNATEEQVPGAVAGLVISAAGSVGLNVLWLLPPGPPPTGYDVEYRTGGGAWQSWTHAGTNTNTTITGLDPATDYQVRVRGTNAAGDGAWSPTGTGRTEPGIGGQQAALAPGQAGAPALTAGETWLEASWTAPNDNGSAITGYDVNYPEAGGARAGAPHSAARADRRGPGR
ncbi:MAG: fibronectin type III domain-containing protein, partial [Acidobacteria bacterium]|nr:fibronectin type III domain-containing protein [Acidobacteriota bacterium]